MRRPYRIAHSPLLGGYYVEWLAWETRNDWGWRVISPRLTYAEAKRDFDALCAEPAEQGALFRG